MLIHDIADYAVAERTRDLPDEVFHHAKRAVIDWCAATAPGAVVMPATGLVKAMEDDIGRGAARLFPSGTPATMRCAAVINAAASHTVEFDDIFRDALYHASTPAVSSALAAAENGDLTGEEFLRAVIVGYEVATRIALVMGRAHYEYWHNTATNGSFGAAAAVATALGLDRAGGRSRSAPARRWARAMPARSCCWSIPSRPGSSPRSRTPRSRCWSRRAIACICRARPTASGRCAAGARSCPPGWSTRRAPRRRERWRRSRRSSKRACRSLASSRRV